MMNDDEKKVFEALVDFEAYGHKFTKGFKYELILQSAVTMLVENGSLKESDYDDELPARGLSQPEKIEGTTVHDMPNYDDSDDSAKTGSVNAPADQQTRAAEVGVANTESDADLTFGQRAVGLKFNPSNDKKVDHIKYLYAEVIDIFNNIKTGPGTLSADQARYFSIAITQAEIACMAAVKAITWE